MSPDTLILAIINGGVLSWSYAGPAPLIWFVETSADVGATWTNFSAIIPPNNSVGGLTIGNLYRVWRGRIPGIKFPPPSNIVTA